MGKPAPEDRGFRSRLLALPSPMIDTHCHLTDPRLGGQLPAVLARAAAAEVTRMVTIGTSIADSRDALALARRLPNVACAVGIHPNYTADAAPRDAEQLVDLLNDPAAVALGEIGLDYFHGRVDPTHQADLFAAQLKIADRLGKPVVIHSREAIDDTLAILADFPGVRAVFHCFTGTAAEAGRIVAAGYLIGFTGPITYKKNDELRNAARRVPADRLLIETDAPYLSPEPVRKVKVCEPAFVAHTAARLAEVRGISLDELDATTTANAERFYGLPPI